MSVFTYHDFLDKIAQDDVKKVIEKDKAYGASWKRRGGTGAYHVMIRKVDRMEVAAEKANFNIFHSIEVSVGDPEGTIEQIRDLRRYLMLIEAEMMAQGKLKPPLGEWTSDKERLTLTQDVAGYTAVYMHYDDVGSAPLVQFKSLPAKNPGEAVLDVAHQVTAYFEGRTEAASFRSETPEWMTTAIQAVEKRWNTVGVGQRHPGTLGTSAVQIQSTVGAIYAVLEDRDTFEKPRKPADPVPDMRPERVSNLFLDIAITALRALDLVK